MGMLVDKSNLGFGYRSWRYSMVVDDGTIEKAFIEEDFSDNCPIDPFETSGADTMLEYLKEGNRKQGVYVYMQTNRHNYHFCCFCMSQLLGVFLKFNLLFAFDHTPHIAQMFSLLMKTAS